MLSSNNFIRKIISKHFRFLINYFRTHEIYKHKFTRSWRTKEATPSLVIFFVDGFIIHGGLADRLKGIISTYAFCKAKSFEFRIAFNYPFLLDDYLIPNKYNWQIKKDEYIAFSKKKAKIINIHNDEKSKKIFKIRHSNSIQYHIYGNMNVLDKINKKYNTDFDWSLLFNELFSPSEYLLELIKENKNRIGAAYISVVFRFQQLLGDFIEPGFETLLENEREKLIKKCLLAVGKLQKETSQKILVTSDSISFINRVEKLNNVYVLSGNVIHMDFVVETNIEKNIHIKSFLDFYMLRNSIEIYSVVDEKIRLSGFPISAALSANIAHKILNI